MNKQVSAIIVLLGIAAVIYAGIRVMHKQSVAQAEKKQKTAFNERLMAKEVVCDDCGVVSAMDIPYKERAKFQVCPNCNAKKARPIVFYVCDNPECHHQLIQYANNVFEGRDYFPNPQGGVTCPNCGRKDTVRPTEISIAQARAIAEETGQEFPYKDE